MRRKKAGSRDTGDSTGRRGFAWIARPLLWRDKLDVTLMLSTTRRSERGIGNRVGVLNALHLSLKRTGIKYTSAHFVGNDLLNLNDFGGRDGIDFKSHAG